MAERSGLWPVARPHCPILIGLLLACAAARAQSPSPTLPPQFREVLAAPQHLNAAIEAAKHSTTWVKNGCQTGELTRVPQVRVWKRPEFDSSNKPIAGQWGEAFAASGCGSTRILNVVTSLRGPGVLISGPLAPGDTSANPTLQVDASRYAFVAVIQRAPGCNQAYLDDTKRIRDGKPDNAQLTGLVHVEHWRFVACGKDITVEMTFLPSATGTDVVAHVL